MAPVMDNGVGGRSTRTTLVILLAGMVLFLAGVLIWLLVPGQAALGMLLLKLGAGATFFTALWRLHRRSRTGP